MNVRVERWPLGAPGVVWIRDDPQVWWVIVDPATPLEYARLRVEFIERLARLVEAVTSESGEDEAPQGAPPLLSPGRRDGQAAMAAQAPKRVHRMACDRNLLTTPQGGYTITG
ncbi:MAG TPA: hypothetical protein VFX53_04540 [Pedococcus sp.]|nr:hypothetical protein [Pedococcus sp.]